MNLTIVITSGANPRGPNPWGRVGQVVAQYPDTREGRPRSRAALDPTGCTRRLTWRPYSDGLGGIAIAYPSGAIVSDEGAAAILIEEAYEA